MSIPLNGVVFDKFLRIHEFPDKIRLLARKFVIFSLLSNILVLLSSTFFVLYIIEKVEYETTGLLFGLMFLTMGLSDYPTGNFVEKFGHSRILAISFILFGTAYLLLVIIISSNILYLVFVLIGLANSQLTGTLQSWFENNYNTFAESIDPNKEKFREVQGRIGMVVFNSSALVFVVSGYVATRFNNGRILVFFIQSLGCFVLAYMFLQFLSNFDELKNNANAQQGYREMIIEELTFIKNNKPLAYFILAHTITFMILIIFDILIVFPLYFGYTGSDFGAGTIRFALFVALGIFSGRSAVFASKLNEKIWLPRTLIMCTTIAFTLTTLLVLFVPIDNTFNVIGLTLMSIIFLLHGFNLVLFNILTQKFYVDRLPNKYRNSVYSLIPTFAFLFATPVVYLSSRIAETQGLETTMGIITLITISSSLLIIMSMNSFDSLQEAETDIDELDHNFLTNVERNENLIYALPPEYYFYDKSIVMLEKLLETARRDHIIADEDEDLLFEILRGMGHYFQFIEIAIKEGIMKPEEQNELVERRNEMIKQAFEGVSKGKGVTEKELNLIKRLNELIHSLHIVEKV